MPRKKKETHIQIEDNPDLVKDTASQAVINTNTNAFINRRQQLSKSKQNEERINKMESDIAEIKKLLKGLSK